jgi:hypothetical protein
MTSPAFRRLTALLLVTGLAACSPGAPGTTVSPNPSTGPGLPSSPPAAAGITWGTSPAPGATPSSAPVAANPSAPVWADDFVLTTPAGWQQTAKDLPGSGYTTRLVVAADPADRAAGEAGVYTFDGVDTTQDNASLVNLLRNFASNVSGATIGADRKLNRGEIGGFAYTLNETLSGQGYVWKKGNRLYYLDIVGSSARLTDAQATAIAGSFALK